MKTLLLALLGVASLLQLTLSLRIGAFNIRAFGDKKLSNQTISSSIVRILTAYDLALIQEVRDTDLSAVKKLMQLINGALPDPFGYLISKPLGRNSYKERYLFIYRQDRVSPVESYYYDDGCEPCGNDAFSREPFIVKFAVSQAAVEELVLVPLHAAPEAAVTEIDSLYDVYQDVKDRWGTTDVLLLGDFNAGCNYVRAEDWPSIRLRSSKDFQWLIPDTADTTVTNTICAYDRIVAVGSKLRESILPATAQVDNFQKTLKLSSKDALAVSDHFPVEVTLKST
ncbi:PREDICTED: deoxyribonuclease-1-like [Thamnophis sirtalis]|uniref:Deoxyribonuclease n=1 Tax=Thamnophis sirtalis TaxID=35019 RepID=A0A6I9YMV2_9SAUR|nr:PREDICTED: deoxyribonuclease-1-like [Thamnophis sirtalis]